MFRFTPKSRLTAQTKGGIALGKVLVIEVDEHSGRIVNFLVAAHRVIPAILDNVLVIGWNQVLDWRADLLIVADAVIQAETANIAVAPSAGSPIQMSERS